MASVTSQVIEEVTAHAQVIVSRMRERYAQTVLTFQITYVQIQALTTVLIYISLVLSSQKICYGTRSTNQSLIRQKVGQQKNYKICN